MTSNVIALPGVSLGAPPPVRPAVKPPVAEHGAQKNFAPRDHRTEQKAEGRSAGSSLPQSPVNLNTLLAAQEQNGQATPAAAPEQGAEQAGQSSPGNQAAQLSESERKQVQELKKQDAEIHRHEQAHAAVGGQYAGAPQYGYTTGPDGQRYANSGHVAIDVTPIAGDPKATIEKMNVVQRAANAPAEPSSADRAVAARAAAAMQTAQAELAKLKAEERAGQTNENAPADKEAPQTDKSEGFVAGFTRDSEKPQAKPATPGPSASHAAAAAAYAAPLNTLAGA